MNRRYLFGFILCLLSAFFAVVTIAECSRRAMGTAQSSTRIEADVSVPIQPVDVIPTPEVRPVRYSIIPPLPPDNASQDWHDGYAQGQLDYAAAFRKATEDMHKAKP